MRINSENKKKKIFKHL